MLNFEDGKINKREMNKKQSNTLNLSAFVLGSSVIGSFLYIIPQALNRPNWGFGVAVKFNMFLMGISVGLVSGIALGFLVWFLFKLSKVVVYKIHYALVSLLGLNLGYWIMRLLDEAKVFMR